VKPGLLQKFYENGKGTDSFQIINILNRPLSRGEVRLNSSRPSDPPLMDPKYFENYEDVKVMVESQKLSVALVENTTTFQKIGARLMPHRYLNYLIYLN
jgi:choline dehydrogenase-like flavoprotein